MREDTRRKLDDLLKAQRATRAAGLIAGTVVVVLFGAIFASSRLVVSEKQVNGTVRWAAAVPRPELPTGQAQPAAAIWSKCPAAARLPSS